MRALLSVLLAATLTFAAAAGGAQETTPGSETAPAADTSGVGTGETAVAEAESARAAREMEVGRLMVQRCAQCHGEGRPAAGLSLERVHFPQSMVGVASAQVDTLSLVEPGEPDRSYLVWKLEDRDGAVGSRMPIGPKPLPEAQIELVKGWIAALPQETAPADTARSGNEPPEGEVGERS